MAKHLFLYLILVASVSNALSQHPDLIEEDAEVSLEFGVAKERSFRVRGTEQYRGCTLF